MKITGGRSYVKIDLENGYVIRADGELLYNNTFLAEKSSMKAWEPPHDKEELSEKQLEEIIHKVKESVSKKTVRIEFE